MTLSEKQTLVNLLNKYQYELLQNKSNSKFYTHIRGTKSQYNHARIIANKLSTEIGNEIHSY